MTKQPIRHDEIVPGQPLRWDLYGRSGELLLRKGFIVRGEQQMRQLGARELYAQRDAPPAPQSAVAQDLPSVVRLLTQARTRLGTLLHAMLRAGGEDGAAELQAIAALVRQACALQPEVALAAIVLDGEQSYSLRHALHTAVLALQLARALGWPADERDALGSAALAMNVGMLHYQERLDDDMPLSPRMREIVRGHPEESVLLLRRAGVRDARCLEWVLQHHENIDGKGYPLGLRGGAITRGAGLIALADRYCAQVTRRATRPPVSPHLAMRALLASGGVDPALLALLRRTLGVYPPGAAVRLVNGELGIVARRAAGADGAPEVASLLGPRGAPLTAPLRRDTGTPLQAIRDVLGVDDLAAALGRAPDMAAIWGAVAAP